MAIMAEYELGCKRCDKFSAGQLPEIILAQGVSLLPTGEYKWIFTQSSHSAITAGIQLIFTTISHHVGPEQVGTRALLMAEALRAAPAILEGKFRLSANFGTGKEDHLHYHFIHPEKEDRLSRDTTNVQEVLREFRRDYPIVPSRALDHLEDLILQPSK